MLLGMFPTGTWSLCGTTPGIEDQKKNSVHSNVCVRLLPGVFSYVFLNTQLLKLDKLGASGLQVESPSGLVGDALLAGTHDEGHEGGRLDLWDEMMHEGLLIRVGIKLKLIKINNKKKNVQADTSRRHTGHMCTWRRPSLV